MLTVAYTLFAMQLLVAATPSPARNGVRHIALTRRQANNSTGVANVEKIVGQIANTLDKHAEGFGAFQANTGQPHDLDILSPNTKRAVGAEPLANDGGTMWVGSMTMGTPPQTFNNIGFDTGSASLVVVNAACTSTDCQNHPRYNPTVSTTSVNRNQPFTLKIDDTTTTSGNQFTDTVTVAGLAATGQVLGAANSYPQGFNAYPTPLDGRMGMGYQAISAYKAPSVPQTLVAQGVTSSPVFGFRLAATIPQINIGGLNPSAYNDPITYTPVTTKGFWQINLDSVGTSPQSRPVGRTPAIIDTGSSMIIGDQANVKKLYDTIPGSQARADGIYTVPCASVPTVSIAIGGASFDIDPTLFNQGPVSVGSDQCVGGIAASTARAPPIRYWSIGDVFLQNVYSVFDLGANRVGFANLA